MEVRWSGLPGETDKFMSMSVVEFISYSVSV